MSAPAPRRGGFTLIELLVALAVFATMAALAYGGLAAVVRARTTLVAQQQDLRELVRAVSLLERDLRGAAARPVRDGYGQPLAALLGTSDHVELTRLGYANPLAEARANLERVFYELDHGTLKRGRYTVLDRAPNSTPILADLRPGVGSFRLRYLRGLDQRWFDVWPPPNEARLELLPRAVEFRLRLNEGGEIRRVLELPATLPPASGSAS